MRKNKRIWIGLAVLTVVIGGYGMLGLRAWTLHTEEQKAWCPSLNLP